MKICTKTWKDIPIAHRLPNHKGRCRFVHGHGVTFKMKFGCHEAEENGFVVDFGAGLRPIGDYLDELDHSFLVAEQDRHQDWVKAMEQAGVARFIFVKDNSTEGLAEHVFERVEALIQAVTSQRVFLMEIELWETPSNSVVYSKRS